MSATTDQIRLLEDLGAQTWPAMRTVPIEGWKLGLDIGVTRRANSVLPNAPAPPSDPETLIDQVERRYRAQDLVPCFKMTDVAQPLDLDRRLERRGYRAEGFSLVLVGKTTQLTHRSTGTAAIDHDNHPTSDWLAACWPADQERDARQLIAERVPQPRVFALAWLDGVAAGAALAAICHDWAVLTAVHTLPMFRRRGIGRSLLSALISWAESKRISDIFLQVEADNLAARRLYAELGFTEAYSYHYLTAPK